MGTGCREFDEKGILLAFVRNTCKFKAAKKKLVKNVHRAGSIFIKKNAHVFFAIR